MLGNMWTLRHFVPLFAAVCGGIPWGCVEDPQRNPGNPAATQIVHDDDSEEESIDAPSTGSEGLKKNP